MNEATCAAHFSYCVRLTSPLALCSYADGHLVLESVMFPGQHIGVRENGEVKKPNHTGRLKHGQFKVKVIKEQPEYHRAGTSLTEVGKGLHARGIILEDSTHESEFGYKYM